MPQAVTSRQVIEMATIAGAASNRILDKVGTLTPGKEADIVVLDARNINTWPMNNVPGTIVTMMNPRHVRDVLIAGKVVYWKGKLVGWNVDALLRQIEQARDRVLARINGTAKVGRIPPGNNSLANPYRPNFLAGCCEKGQNTTAPAYVLRPPPRRSSERRIAGVVKDTSGAVLPGVTVEAASPALIEKVRTVVTDGEGRYNIVDLRPGSYSVTFRLPGFNTVKREGITLTAGFTATVNADLQVGALEETITVTGAAPLVDTQNVRQQNVVRRDCSTSLPTGSRM